MSSHPQVYREIVSIFLMIRKLYAMLGQELIVKFWYVPVSDDV